MLKHVALALAVPLWLAAQPAGICGEKTPGPLNVEGPGLSATAGGSCRTIAAIVRVYPALEVRKTGGEAGDLRNGPGSPAGCRVLASGPTSAVEGEVLPEEAVRELFLQDGWEEDPAYAADGPGTTSFALRKGGTVCIVSAGTPSAIDDGTIFTVDTYRFEAWCKLIRP